MAKKKRQLDDDALFEQYDFDDLKDELNIVALAKLQARENRPLSDSQYFDVNEQKIKTFFADGHIYF